MAASVRAALESGGACRGGKQAPCPIYTICIKIRLHAIFTAVKTPKLP